MTDGTSAPRLSGYRSAIAAPIEWKSKAACAEGLIPSWVSDGFFLDLSRHARDRLAVEEAKQVCARCPVKVECGEHALAIEAQGVWGGIDTREREQVIRERRRAARRG